MASEDFRLTLKQAMSGDQDALEELLLLYKPLIDRHSRIHGVIDEDLRQHLLLYILLHIHEFPIDGNF